MAVFLIGWLVIRVVGCVVGCMGGYRRAGWGSLWLIDLLLACLVVNSRKNKLVGQMYYRSGGPTRS